MGVARGCGVGVAREWGVGVAESQLVTSDKGAELERTAP